MADGAPVTANLDPQLVLDRLDELQREVAALRQGMGAPAAGPGRERIEVVPTDAHKATVAAVLAAFDEIERGKVGGMSTEELVRSARQLRKNVEDRDRATRRLEIALERELSPQRRGELMSTLGVWYRERKTPVSLAASERTFQAVVDQHGLGTELGQSAAYQLIWTAEAQNDPQRGIELARSLQQNSSAPVEMRTKARYAEAVMIEDSGNKAQAHAAYRALLQELKVLPGTKYVWIISDMRDRLGN